jgi:hypothetical protein
LYGIRHSDAIHYHDEISGTATENLIAIRYCYIRASRAYRKVILRDKQIAPSTGSDTRHYDGAATS